MILRVLDAGSIKFIFNRITTKIKIENRYFVNILGFPPPTQFLERNYEEKSKNDPVQNAKSLLSSFLYDRREISGRKKKKNNKLFADRRWGVGGLRTIFVAGNRHTAPA